MYYWILDTNLAGRPNLRFFYVVAKVSVKENFEKSGILNRRQWQLIFVSFGTQFWLLNCRRCSDSVAKTPNSVFELKISAIILKQIPYTQM
jgi:hypothetical protein